MLTLLAIGLIGTLFGLLLSGRVSTISALIVTPVVFALIGGFGPQIGAMAMKGLAQTAPSGVMLAFAVLYFSLMSDAGLFDPLIRRIVRMAHGSPVRIVTATAVLGLVVSMDGDGSTTYLICCAALLPLYRKMGLDPRILACLLTLACGITNVFPWGGPTARIAASLKLDATDIFVPLLPGMGAAAVSVVLIGVWFGLREQRRLGVVGPARAPSLDDAALLADLSALDKPTARPRLIWVNLALTVVVFVGLVMAVLPLPILFMIATAAALLINYTSPEAQNERLAAHALTCFRVASFVFAAGIFVGILQESGMSTALARAIADNLPPGTGPYLAPVSAVLSMPMTFFMGNTTYFYGVLPILAEAGQIHGIAPVEMARAVLVSQAVHLLCPMVASSFLLTGLTGIGFGEHQRFTMKWALLVSFVILAVSLLIGAIPFRAGV